MQTINVPRQLPRKSRIINPVSPAAIAPSRRTPSFDAFTNRLVKELRNLQVRGKRRLDRGQFFLYPLDDGKCGCLSASEHRQQSPAVPIVADYIRLHGVAVSHVCHVLDIDGGAVHRHPVSYSRKRGSQR